MDSEVRKKRNCNASYRRGPVPYDSASLYGSNVAAVRARGLRIVGQENGQWVVRSGNDGGGVRSRTRSLAGAIAIRNVGGGFAVAGFEQPQYRASYQHHYQRVASVEHRTPLWMYEETVQPDRFGAAAGS